MNKAHFGMPFHGRQKQTRGLRSQPRLPLLPTKLTVSPARKPVFCPLQTLHYCNIANISNHTKNTNTTVQFDHVKC